MVERGRQREEPAHRAGHERGRLEPEGVQNRGDEVARVPADVDVAVVERIAEPAPGPVQRIEAEVVL
jgi:hypothetical protein